MDIFYLEGRKQLVDIIGVGEGKLRLVVSHLCRGVDTKLLQGWLQLLKHKIVYICDFFRWEGGRVDDTRSR